MAAGLSCGSQEDYFPIAKDSTWEYAGSDARTAGGAAGEKQTGLMRVRMIEDKGDGRKVRMEFGEGSSSLEGIYGVTDTEVLRGFVLYGTGNVSPPIPTLKLPPQTGQKWDWAGNVNYDGPEVPATDHFSVAGKETVKTPAGTYSAYRVDEEYQMETPGSPLKLHASWWYAPNVGLVRFSVKGEGGAKGPKMDAEMTLTKYTKGG